MAQLLPPVRILSAVDEGLLAQRRKDDEWQHDKHSNPKSPRLNALGDILPLRHGYLHSLISTRHYWTAGKGHWGEDSGRGQHRRLTVGERDLGIEVPPTTAAPRLVTRRRASWHSRSRSEPLVGTPRRMAAVMEEKEEGGESTVPSSPPDLSYSKSSQSSSSSDGEGEDNNPSTDKLSHFDDVSVDGRDSVDDSNLRPESRPTLRRPPPRSATMSEMGRGLVSPPLAPKERGYPSLRGAVNGVLRDQSLNLPHGRGMRRTITTPASPSYPFRGSQRMSRSPSPSKPIMMENSVSPHMMASRSTPRLAGEPPSPLPHSAGPFARRKSWQPGRKSVKQLEAEYDDFDEEVPDEAVLENVPISPMPGQMRLSPRPSPHPSRSTTPSPHRRPSHPGLPSAPSHSNLHSANVPKNAKRPKAPTVMPNGQYGSPRSPRNHRPPPLQHSVTLPIGEAFNRRLRAKSWTEDLNEEARALSAALEEYEDRREVERHGSGANSVSSSPPRPSFAVQRSKTMIMDMPPISYGHIHIDPLPVSKEKEAVLSRTRPSWLPPKDQKEERKHLKEWEAMMAKAAENEKKRQMKELEAQEDTDEIKDGIAKLWEQHVLPNWDTVINEPRTRELWWRGVTPSSRGLVWQKAIGNELELSESSYDAALKHMHDLEEKFLHMSPEDRMKHPEAAWLDAITRDVPLTCPELNDPTKRTPFESALRDVLKAYSIHHRDIGYIYGTHLIAGFLCLHLRPADAFIALANTLNRSLSRAFLLNDAEGTKRAYDLVFSTLKYKFTKLHDHLTDPKLDLKPGDYLDPMFRSLFAYHLPAPHASRLWDIFVFEGDKALIRTAVAVLGRLETRLYGSKEEILQVVGWQNAGKLDLGTEEEFIKAVRDAGKVDAGGEVVKTVYV